MELKIKKEVNKADKVVSNIEFNDNAIAEIVTFWTNVKYQSPQFPLDLTPNDNQLNTLYKDGKIPSFGVNQTITFEVTVPEAGPISLPQIIQLKVNFLGEQHDPDNIPTLDTWNKYFKSTENLKLVCTPDGSAYLSPGNKESNSITVSVVDNTTDDSSNKSKYFSYEVLVAFDINGDTYYANFDPLAKVTSGKT
ncbi:hypothetical protein [Reichenbachiella versicolor]|uniref:hypothetical protein n=1 Tax=Reichenbachiella versicolor TaxID=1821036 RepID=UPI000D6DE9F3|nr:hypothetical protein [Reichenbachiella versicolor]